MSQQRVEISKNVLQKCLGLTAGETLLVVTDDDKKELGESIYEAGKALGAEAAILTMKVRSKSGKSLRHLW